MGRTKGINDIGPTKMLGLLYLLDVEHMARHGEPATKTSWIWNDYGPFETEAAYGPRSDPYVEEAPYGGPYGNVYRLVSDETFELEGRIGAVLDEVFDRFGRMSASTIKTYCYDHTEPMIQVQKTGERGDRLDLSLVRRQGAVDDTNPSSDLKDIVSRIGSSRPENNTFDDSLLDTVDAGANLRDRATRRLQGE